MYGYDIEGNIIEIGDVVYICDSFRADSKSKRLIRCTVESIFNKGLLCKVKCKENDRVYSKYTSSCIKPLIT